MEQKLFIGIADGDFSNTLFPPHGRYSARVDKRIVRMEATGPFNAEMAHIYAQKTGPLYMSLNQSGPFGVLIEFFNSMMMGVETLQVFSDFLNKAKQNGIQTVGTAFVVADDVEGSIFMVDIFRKKVYEPASISLAVFKTATEAERWLHDRLDHYNLITNCL